MRVVQGKPIAEWFTQRGRVLPWRQEPRNPYHVVVSEFMLQQTQVDRVVPHFSSFVARFPDFEALARASEEEVLDEWSGLGYYRRARLLHALAQEVAERPGGLPHDVEELARLPGIGPYTAAAVASLAFGEAVPVLDGNVMRVGARVMAMEENPRSAGGRRHLIAWVRSLMKGQPAAAINEALMELGATVCFPTDPDCGRCPLETECIARAKGWQARYPPPRRRRATESLRWVAACVVSGNGSWLLRRIDKGPILRGLWLPALATLEDGADPLREARRLVPLAEMSDVAVAPPVRHNITHRRIDVIPVRLESESKKPPSENWRWVDPDNPKVPTSSLLRKLADALSNDRSNVQR
jgi:A/G-specific adenine glycosylase